MDVIITPEPGRQKEIGQLLFSLADTPRDVRWVTWPTAGFSVPQQLFTLFEEALQELKDAYEKPADEPAPPKRRGRPRKESTDNNTSEEE